MARRILDGRGLTAEQDYRIDAFTSPEPLTDQLAAQPKAYALLLLDIELAGKNGVKLASFLRKKQFTASIIYITGHAGFTMDSFPTRPLDYLLKPVDEARLAAALDWDLQKWSSGPNGPCSAAERGRSSCPASAIWRSTGAGPWPIWTKEMKRSRSLFPS